MGKRLSKIYTRTGDKGETGLGDGSRIAKDHIRIHAIGSCDELNSHLGMAIEELKLCDEASLTALVPFLSKCQHRIFDLGGEISIPGFKILNENHVKGLEEKLDELNEDLAPLENFIMQGGSRLIASIHIARSVARRAERELVELSQENEINSDGLRYLNRLSDLLFVVARYAAKQTNVDEILWEKE